MSNNRILIVDDEIDLRIFLMVLFKTIGHFPVAARDGIEGFRKAMEQPPDLVMLDVMMPGEDGIMMYRKLKTDPRLRKIPVLILSAVNPQSFKHFLKMHNAHAKTPLPEPMWEKTTPGRKTVGPCQKTHGGSWLNPAFLSLAETAPGSEPGCEFLKRSWPKKYCLPTMKRESEKCRGYL